MDSSTRVTVNTFVQYGRTVITVLITLYTARVVLDNLGQNDYGIYSLVGGLITMFAFIQSNLSQTTVRFLSYYLGRGDKAKVVEIFNNSLITQLIVGAVLCCGLLCVTDWLFGHFLNIAPERMSSARTVYFVMIAALFVNMLSAPFLAALIAHENMVYSSAVQIADAVLKLPIALSLIWISQNKLVWYASWMAGLIVVNIVCYAYFCHRKFPECGHFSFRSFRFSLFKEMFSFMGWNVYGTLCITGVTQGLALVLNHFFTTAINAAYGIGNQVAGQIGFLANSLSTAINPQIIKAEGAGNRRRMIRLTEISCKFSFLLMSMVSIPLLIYMDDILRLWLKDVPPHTAMFCFFIVLSAQIDLLSSNMGIANQAIGNVKLYIVCNYTFKFLTLPAAWLLLKWGYGPTYAMVALLVVETMAVVTRVVFLKININLSLRKYLRNVVVSALPTVGVNACLCWMLSRHLHGWWFLFVMAVSVVATCALVWSIGLNPDEREILRGLIAKFRNKLKSKNTGSRGNIKSNF